MIIALEYHTINAGTAARPARKVQLVHARLPWVVKTYEGHIFVIEFEPSRVIYKYQGDKYDQGGAVL